MEFTAMFLGNAAYFAIMPVNVQRFVTNLAPYPWVDSLFLRKLINRHRNNL